MRNDVHPVPPDADLPHSSSGDVNKPAAGAGFDDEHASGVSRERGDSVDPAGPKPSEVAGDLGEGGAITDPSGTTGTVSRSNDRLSTTTGSLGDSPEARDLERSARQSAEPDVRALSIPTGDSSMSVPILMAVLAVVIAVLALIAFFSWPSDAQPADDSVADLTSTEAE